MTATQAYAAYLRDQLGHLATRRMFGKTGIFCDGLMFAMVTDNTLYFRVDALNRAAFQEAANDPPLNYEKQGQTIDLSFWRAPDRLFDDPDELLAWARLALAAARRVAATRKRKTPAGINPPTAPD